MLKKLRNIVIFGAALMGAMSAHGATTRYVELRSTLQPNSTGLFSLFVGSGTIQTLNTSTMNVRGPLTVTGTATINGTLGVTGVTTLSSATVTGTMTTVNATITTGTVTNLIATLESLGSGSVAAASLRFSVDPTTGWSYGGSGLWNWSSAGVLSAILTPNNIQTVSGSASVPAFSTINDSDTGMYFASANQIGWATNGIGRSTMSAAQFDVTVDTFNFIGKMLRPTQPRFHVSYAATSANVTGDGTQYTYTWPTESIDVGNNFGVVATTYCFTAPITGVYGFHVTADLSNFGVAHTQRRIDLVTTGGTFTKYMDGVAQAATDFTMELDAPVVAMTKGDIAYVTTKVSNSTKTVGVGSGSGAINYFMGELKN